jgi:hypothetical protein
MGLSPRHQCHGCEVADATFAPAIFTIHAAFMEDKSAAGCHATGTFCERGHPQFIEVRMVEVHGRQANSGPGRTRLLSSVVSPAERPALISC